MSFYLGRGQSYHLTLEFLHIQVKVSGTTTKGEDMENTTSKLLEGRMKNLITVEKT